MKRLILILASLLITGWLHAQVSAPVFVGSGTLSNRALGENAFYSFNVGGLVGYYLADSTVNSNNKGIIPIKAKYQFGFPYNILYLEKTFTKNLWVSKGYYANYIHLKWEVASNKSKIEKFEVYRNTSLVATLSLNATEWKDFDCEGNKLYNYELHAVGIPGMKADGYTYTSGTGFRLPVATVSGNISYEGGNAVEGAIVSASSTDTISSSALLLSGFKSLEIKSENDIPLSNGFTFQAYLKFSKAGNAVILNDNNFNLAYNNGTKSFDFKAGNSSVSLPFEVPLNAFFHISAINSADSLNIMVVRNFINNGGYLVDTVYQVSKKKQTGTSPVNGKSFLVGGTTEDGLNLTIDELRLWGRPLTQTEVLADYSRYITGSETGLLGYWRCNEGFEKMVYDISKSGNTFNERHGTISSATSDFWTQVCPSVDQLGFKGITDKNGNYTISSIPYKPNGSAYNITPKYGQHKFDPGTRSLFISENSNVHNKIDFKDISAFDVSGKIVYRNTNLGVKAVNIMVDGKFVYGADNKTVTTDNSGNFKVKVPVGFHYIGFEKQRHQFDKNARWPYNSSKPDSLVMHYFDRNIMLQEDIIDTTLVTVVGKVLGGTKGDDLPTGFGSNSNNIGTATITLRHDAQSALLFENTDTIPVEYKNKFLSLVAPDNREIKVYDSILYRTERERYYTKIITNAESGEFITRLIPEKFENVSISVQGDANSNVGNYFKNQLTTIDLSSIPDTSYQYLYQLDETAHNLNPEIEIEKILLDSLLYHVFRKFEYRVKPEITVTDTENKELFTGEKTIRYIHPKTKQEETINIADNFSYPVFKMGVVYNARINLFETYKNFTDRTESKQPVQNASVQISNKLAFAGNESATIKVEPKDNGSVTYSFRAGEPNIIKAGAAGIDSTSFTKIMQVNATIANSFYEWKPDEDYYRAYVLGDKIKGNNFYSVGPQKPLIILRDPPGSNSYAYIEKGSNYTSTLKYSAEIENGAGLNVECRFGVKVAAGGGLAGPLVENETYNSVNTGQEYAQSTNKYGEITESYTFNERIETSSDPDMVGSLADVYIGRSTNYYYGETDQLNIFPLDLATEVDLTRLQFEKLKGEKKYTIGLTNSYAVSNDPKNTYFAYSQAHIISELIPEMETKKKNLFLVNPKYVSLLDKDDIRYGWANHFESVYSDGKFVINGYFKFGDDKILSYKFFPEKKKNILSSTTIESGNYETDSVDYFNRQIVIWLDALKLNEREKSDAITNKLVEDNISFDAGVGLLERIYTKTDFVEEGLSHAKSMSFNTDGSVGSVFNGFGVLTLPKIYMNASKTAENSNSNENSVTFGYVIDDDDVGDYFSIDVLWKNKGFFAWAKERVEKSSASLKNDTNWDLVSQIVGTIEENTAKHTDKDLDLVNESKLSHLLIIGSINQATNSLTGVATLAAAGFQIGGIIKSFSNFDDFTAKISDKINPHVDSLSSSHVFSFEISSPMFSVIGGQTMCPFQDSDSTLFYRDENTKQPIALNNRTLKRDDPKIEITPRERKNIPVGEKAVFQVNILNESDNLDDQWYTIRVEDGTNPNGAIIKIDGNNPNQSFMVPGGQQITKTLTVEPGDPSKMDFKDIVIIIHSNCQYDPTAFQESIYDADTISVSFQPSCSPVTILEPTDNWVVNVSDKGKLDVKLTGYNKEMSSFKGIFLQKKYASAGDDTWVNVVYFTNNPGIIDISGNGDTTFIEGPVINYSMDVSEWDNQTYKIRVKAVCEEGIRYSEIRNGIIDTNPPKVFGNPEPADGILNWEDNLLVRFNEPIEGGFITKGNTGNLLIKGRKNSLPIYHYSYLKFDGSSGYGKIPRGISLNDKSFTIEFWVKPDNYNESVIFVQGKEEKNKIEIGLKGGSNPKVFANFGSRKFESDLAFTVELERLAWYHLAFAYNYANKMLYCFKDGKEVFQAANVEFDFISNDEIVIGKNNSESKFFAGSLHELRIWSKYISEDEVFAAMNTSLTGNENGLYGYWKMDEAWGSFTIDKASNRNMQTLALWELDKGGYSAYFNSQNYLELRSEYHPIKTEMDYTIEFWFKTKPSDWITDSVCFMSNFRGFANEGIDFLGKTMSIIGTKNGKIKIYSSGKVFEAVTNNYFDDKWHHFSLTVRRRGNAIAMVDGIVQNEKVNTIIGGLEGATMLLGARKSVTNAMDCYLNGFIDEFRIWNLARTKNQIEFDKNSRLEGTETGLLSYYPFDNLNSYGEVLTTLQNFMTNNQVQDAKIIGGTVDGTIRNNSPNIKRQQIWQNIDFDFIPSAQEILFKISDNDLLDLEKSHIEIFVKSIFDGRFNEMASPETWSAYIHRNQVRWEDENRSINKEIYKTYSFITSVKNTGGQSHSFSITNLPPWLNANPSSGIIKPESTVSINFSINSALNIGEYNHDIIIQTDKGYKEKLPITVKVYKTPPKWVIIPENFENSMNIVGRVKIESAFSSDIFDKVAAFKVGTDSIRGVSNVRYIPEFDSYLVFLSIYGNTENEELEFRIWDASVGQIIDNVLPANVHFNQNAVLGSIINPEILDAQNVFRQYIPLNKGWNWVSFNKDSKFKNSLNLFLSSLEPCMNDQIKLNEIRQIPNDNTGIPLIENLSGFNTVDLTGDNPIKWEAGNIDSINNTRMYQLKICQRDTIIYSGKRITPEDITIKLYPGWNHIGYLPDFSMDINDALRFYNAENADIIKSQFAFSMFDSLVGWIGTLDVMEPGIGYMLKSKHDLFDFKYPNNTVFKNGIIKKDDIAPLLWKNNFSEYESTISIVAKLNLSNLPELKYNENMVLGGFVQNECHGFSSSVLCKSLNYNPFFLNISNNENGQEINFKIYDGETGNTYLINESLTFIKDEVYGTIEEPIVLTINSRLTGLTEFEKDEFFNCFPNPFTEKVTIEYKGVRDKIRIDVLNSSGKIIHTIYDGYPHFSTGIYEWDGCNQTGSAVTSGIYFIRFVSQKSVKSVKISKAH